MSKFLTIILLILLIINCGSPTDIEKDVLKSDPGSTEKYAPLEKNRGKDEGSPQSKKLIIFSTPFPENTSFFRAFKAIYSEAFNRMGYEFKLLTYPIERSLIEADSGRIDGDVSRIYELNSDNKYPNLIRINEPDMKQKTCVYSRNPDIKIYIWDDFRDTKYNIAYMKGNKSVEIKLPKISGNKIIIVTRPDQLLEMMLAGRIDIFIAPDEIKKIMAKNSGRYSAIRHITCLEEVNLYPYINKKHSNIAPLLASTLKIMKKDGSFKIIIDKIK